MAELLTHVLVAYGLFTALGWYVDWIDERWVAVAMVGSILPDLSRIDLVLSSDRVAALLGVSFDWGGLHTVGGAVLLSAIGALLFSTARTQRRAFLALLGGALSHLVVDVPQAYADGLALTNRYLYPLPPWRPPTPGWYVSADRWVVVVAFAFAVLVYALDRRRR